MIEYTVKVYANGNKQWYLNGQRHREDGPAIERPDGYKAWWLNGLRHREDGPAIEYANGNKQWWLNGLPAEEEFNERTNGQAGLLMPMVQFRFRLTPIGEFWDKEKEADFVKQVVKCEMNLKQKELIFVVRQPVVIDFYEHVYEIIENGLEGLKLEYLDGGNGSIPPDVIYQIDFEKLYCTKHYSKVDYSDNAPVFHEFKCTFKNAVIEKLGYEVKVVK